jgi:hypothetical protein
MDKGLRIPIALLFIPIAVGVATVVCQSLGYITKETAIIWYIVVGVLFIIPIIMLTWPSLIKLYSRIKLTL